MKRILCFLLLLSASCCRPHINVRNDYLTVERYASFHAGTPDPRLICPQLGQMLTISWNLEDIYGCYESLYLLATIRYGNLEQIQVAIPAGKAHGSYQYKLTDSDYWHKKGILTYKVELIGDERVVDAWKHQLWVELIAFDKTAYDGDE